MEALKVIAALVVPLVPFLIVGAAKATRFINRFVRNNDVSCRVLNHHRENDIWSTEIKVAYVGEKPAILSDILFSYELEQPSPGDSFMQWVNIAMGYLTCDMQGLTTILGTKDYEFAPPMVHLWKSRWTKYPMSVLVGLYFSYFILLALLLSPTLIPLALLGSGPYGRFALSSTASSMSITYAEGIALELPFVLNQGDERILELKYRVGLSAKGFPADTPYQFLTEWPKRTFRPPKPGNFAWRGRGTLSVLGRKGWGRVRMELGDKVIVGIGRM